MALGAFWAASPEAVLKLNIQQIISAAGNGLLRDGGDCSVEFRKFIREIDSSRISNYVRSCLEQSFKDSGLVLQDLINEMGRRLEFEVEDGLYRGKPSAIGFDGIWRAQNGEDIIVEVKTTDYVNISLDKIANYRNRLISEGRVSKSPSILIVVGREDTGAIEAQIRGSRYAWEMRLISADRLDYLLQIKEKSDDNNTVLQIQELLRPFEYTKVDKIIDVMFSAARDMAPVEQVHRETSSADQPTFESDSDGDQKGGHKQDRTATDLLNRHRLDAINGFGRKLGVNFQRHRQTLFWTPDRKIRVCAAVSKRYDNSYKPYWYAFHPHWDQFLAEGEESYFVLACMDRQHAFAIPHDEVRRNLPDCSQTFRESGKSYWHIALGVFNGDSLVWDITKVQRKIDLAPYQFDIAVSADMQPAKEQ